MGAELWLGLQQDWDLWHALRSKQAAMIEALEPLPHVADQGGMALTDACSCRCDHERRA